MKLVSILEGAKTIGITGHIRPDGDCVGACLGLYNYIQRTMPEKKADVYLEAPGEPFDYMENYDCICHEMQEEKVYDVFIVLDCSSPDRIQPFLPYFENAKKTVCIDHHISNQAFADMNYVEPEASSTCEVLYGLMEEEQIDKAVAECLYTGIIHDTGVFKYSCTSSRTMMIAGKLMERGIDYSDIIDNSFYKKTYIQNQILGRALLESVLFYNGLCIFSAISQKDMNFYGVEGKELGGIIEQLRLTDGVEVAIFLYETGPMIYKVSMRSKKYIDVSKVAEFFGGGGHIRAAGFTLHGKVHDIINNISTQLKPQFDQAGVEI